jgi:glycosyltransferase involved in cell wall biosynthesis
VNDPVTVVIPTFRRPAFLRQAIDSVLAQTYPSFELIVSDNCSDDETAEVVRAASDARVRYLRQPFHMSLNEHFSRCLEAGRSTYVFLLPDDDLMHPELLARTVAVLDASPAVGMVHTMARIVDSNGHVIHPAHNMTRTLDSDATEEGDVYIHEAMRGTYRVHGSTVLFRRAAIRGRSLRYEEADYPATDFALMLRLALDWDVAFIAQPLADYRIHTGTYTASAGADAEAGGYVQGVEMILKIREVKLRFLSEHAERFPDSRALRRAAHRAATEELIVRAGRLTLPRRKRTDTVRRLAEACRADPRVLLAPDAWRLLIGSLLGQRLRSHLRSQYSRAVKVA